MGSTLDKIPQMGRAQSSRSRTRRVGVLVVWFFGGVLCSAYPLSGADEREGSYSKRAMVCVLDW